MRVGPPEISGGKTFWPVQIAVYKIHQTFGVRGTRREFTGWETQKFFDSKEAAVAFVKESGL